MTGESVVPPLLLFGASKKKSNEVPAFADAENGGAPPYLSPHPACPAKPAAAGLFVAHGLTPLQPPALFRPLEMNVPALVRTCETAVFRTLPTGSVPVVMIRLPISPLGVLSKPDTV